MFKSHSVANNPQRWLYSSAITIYMNGQNFNIRNLRNISDFHKKVTYPKTLNDASIDIDL